MSHKDKLNIIKYQSLVKELIKENYNINLCKLKEITYMMDRNECETVEDWDKVEEYVSQYTEKTNERFPNWDNETSFELYYSYLKEFENTGAPVKPIPDMFYLLEGMRKEKKKEIRYEKESLKVFEDVSKDKYKGQFMR